MNSAALRVSRNTSLVKEQKSKGSDGTMFAQILASAFSLSCDSPCKVVGEREVQVAGWANGLQRRCSVVGLYNKVNSFCRSVQVQSLLIKLKPCGSATLEFHYTVVRVCRQGVGVCGGAGADTASLSTGLQIGGEQVVTVNLLQRKQNHSEAKRGTNGAGQKCVFGAVFWLLWKHRFRRHKGLIHALSSPTARFLGRSSSVNIPLSFQVCSEYNVKKIERVSSSFSSFLTLLILLTEDRLVLGSEPTQPEENKCSRHTKLLIYPMKGTVHPVSLNVVTHWQGDKTTV